MVGGGSRGSVKGARTKGSPLRKERKKILKTVGTKIQGQRLISDDEKMQQMVTNKT